MTYVDIQLRPKDPNHLWYAYSVLDWPTDQQGQVQDGDGATFADVGSGATRTEPNEAYGDMKLVPMLEVQINSSDTQLPTADELLRYNIATRDLDRNKDGKPTQSLPMFR